MMIAKTDAHTDPEDLAAIVDDVRRGMEFIRRGYGYGAVTIEIQVRPNGIAEWIVTPCFTRKPRREGKREVS